MAGERLWDQVARHRAVIAQGGTPDRAELRKLIGCGDKDVASAAAALLLKVDARSSALFVEDEALFVRLAESDTVTERLGAALASGVAWRRVLMLIGEQLKTNGKQPPDPAAIAEIARIAELGHKRDPESPRSRYTLALVRSIQNRPAEGRALLVNAPLERLPAADRVDLMAVRALIELDLGDIAQAKRLASAARRENHDTGLFKFTLVLIALAEKRAQ